MIPALAAVLFYLPVLGNDFVNWDDPRNILNNPYIRNFGPDAVRRMFTDF